MKKISIILTCFFLSILDQMFMRPLFKGYSLFLDILLGSLPSFLFVVGFSYLLIFCFLKYKKINFQKSTTTSILAALIGSVVREIMASNSQGFGGTFDYYDIIFCFFGATFVYILENRKIVL